MHKHLSMHVNPGRMDGPKAAGLSVYKIPNISNRIRVSTAETMMDPRQPRRLEKKKNTDISLKFERWESMQKEGGSG